MQITIPNFGKYNPREDVKRGTWFRFQNDAFGDEALFSATALTKLVWVYLLCLRSKHGDDAPFLVNVAKGAAMMPCGEDDFVQSVAWLTASGFVSRTDTAADVRARPQTCPTDVRTERDDTRHNPPIPPCGAGAGRLPNGGSGGRPHPPPRKTAKPKPPTPRAEACAMIAMLMRGDYQDDATLEAKFGPRKWAAFIGRFRDLDHFREWWQGRIEGEGTPQTVVTAQLRDAFMGFLSEARQ